MRQMLQGPGMLIPTQAGAVLAWHRTPQARGQHNDHGPNLPVAWFCKYSITSRSHAHVFLSCLRPLSAPPAALSSHDRDPMARKASSMDCAAVCLQSLPRAAAGIREREKEYHLNRIRTQVFPLYTLSEGFNKTLVGRNCK